MAACLFFHINLRQFQIKIENNCFFFSSNPIKIGCFLWVNTNCINLKDKDSINTKFKVKKNSSKLKAIGRTFRSFLIFHTNRHNIIMHTQRLLANVLFFFFTVQCSLPLSLSLLIHLQWSVAFFLIVKELKLRQTI